MEGVKSISLLLVAIALFAFWLEHENKLPDALVAVTMGGGTPIRTDGPTMGAYVVALLTFVFLLSLMNPKHALGLTAIVAVGALIANKQRAGSNDVINQLFGGGALSPSETPPTSGGTGGLSGPISPIPGGTH